MNIRLIKCESWEINTYNDVIICESSTGEKCEIPITFDNNEYRFFIPKSYHDIFELNTIPTLISYVTDIYRNVIITFVVENAGVKIFLVWERAINKLKSKL